MPKKPIDYTPRAERKEVEIKLDLTPCCNCGKTVDKGYYGRFGNGGVCSKACNTAQELKPKYPEPSALFLQQMEQSDGLDEGFETDTQVS